MLQIPSILILLNMWRECDGEAEKEHQTALQKRTYKSYFVMKLGDQGKSWGPHIVCETCVEALHDQTSGKVKLRCTSSLEKPKIHFDDCYFCLNVYGRVQQKQDKTWKYPNLESAIKPVAYSEELPLPLLTTLSDIEETQDISLPDHTVVSRDNSCSDYEEPSYDPQQFNQSELYGLV